MLEIKKYHPNRSFLIVLGIIPLLSITGCLRSDATTSQPMTAAHDLLSSPSLKAPNFIGSARDWINTPPLTMAGLRGKVVLVDFWEYTCVNCIRTLPYLKDWYQRYHNDGFVIVGIHTPEFRFAHDRANVIAAVKRFGITYPVLIDDQYANWNAYHNSFWPHDFLIDPSGDIVEDHAGEGGYTQTELAIQELLHRLHPNLRFPAPVAPIHSADQPDAVCYPMTPETYAGERGFMERSLNNIGRFEPGKVAFYQDPHDYPDGVITLQGLWATDPESLRHARLTTQNQDYIALRYHAIQANAVIRPIGNAAFKLIVTQDGKPVPHQDAGADIRYDKSGASYILVRSSRMYNIIKNRRYGSHLLELSANSNRFALYSFTFSSCAMPVSRLP